MSRKDEDALEAKITASQSKAAAEVVAATFATGPVPTGLDEFAQYSADAAQVDGFDLADKSLLIGVPFVIIGVSYRDGIARKDGKATVPQNYISLEIVLGNQAALNRARTRGKIPGDFPFDPCERLVINDGSTGIMRQITQYLSSQGAISLPAGAEAGAAGESRYDTYRAGWLAASASFGPEDQPHFDLTAPELAVRPLMCPRGLRRSDYDAGGAESTTYYLA